MTWVALTLLAFALGVAAQWRVRHPLVNPTLVATVIVSGALLLTATPYREYTAEVRPLSFLLGPAVVALAVPLYRLRALLAREWRALGVGGLFVGVDAPDFNLGLERRLRQAGVRTAHFVSPSIWAWRGGRIRGIGRAVDRMLVVFPFEQAIYARAGIDAATVVTIGAELSLWSPLLRHWLIWMRRECPDIAVSTQIERATLESDVLMPEA